MIWLVASLGVCIGALAGMLGAGPSILTVLLLSDVAGLGVRTAMGTSLTVVSVMSLVALFQYMREHAVPWKSAVSFGLASMTAAFAAGHVARLVPRKVLLLTFLVSMIAAGLAMLVRRPMRELEPARAGALSVAVLVGSGLIIGCLTGLISLGGGFALVPLLVLYARVPIRCAVGASLLVITINTLAGLAGRLPHPPVDWHVAGYLSGTEAMGSVFGVGLSRRMTSTALRRAFAVVMLVAAGFMIFHTFFT
jgi:uncharacterized membrane protein YfcA